MGKAQVASLYSSLTLESSSFVSGLKEAADATAKSTHEMAGHFNELLETTDKVREGFEHFIEYEAIRQFAEIVEKALEAAGSLAAMSKQIGVTTDDLQTMRYAASQVGVSQENLDQGLQKFTKSVSEARAGNKEIIGTFQALGISMADIKTDDPHDLLLKTADGLSTLRDNATRAAPEITLFGRALGQQLDPLLSQGSNGINGLADAARDLGLVLSEEQIENADKTAHKLAELKMVLSAQIAGAVADDAAEIMSLVAALERLVGMIETVNDRLDQAKDVIAESQGSLRSGLYGILGMGTGNAFAEQMRRGGDEQAAAARDDYNERSGNIAARDLSPQQKRDLGVGLDPGVFSAKAEPKGGSYTDPAAAAAAQRASEKAAREREEAAKKAAAAAKAAEEARKREVEREKRVAQQNAQLDDQEISTREGMTADIVERASLERDRVDASTKAKLTELADQVSARQVTEQEAITLRAKIERNAALEQDAINEKENIALQADTMKVAAAHLADLEDEASAQESLAHSSKERLAIALRMLAVEKEAERAQLQVQLDDIARDPDHKRYTAGDATIAQNRMDSLDSRYDLKEQGVRQSNAGPLDAYRKQISDATSDMNEALQSVEVDGLKGIEDGLTGIIDQTESVGKAFHNMAMSILNDLLKIAIEKKVIGPLANSLFGAGPITGDVGSFANSGISAGISGPVSLGAAPTIDVGFANSGISAGISGPVSLGAAPTIDVGFATGGSFGVGGIGGTDSQLMQFWATPGEMVNVSKGGSDAGQKGTTVHQTVQFSGGVDLATRTEVYRVADATHRATMAAIDERNRRRA